MTPLQDLVREELSAPVDTRVTAFARHVAELFGDGAQPVYLRPVGQVRRGGRVCRLASDRRARSFFATCSLE